MIGTLFTSVDPAITPVVGLLFTCGPFAIAGGVVFVIVDTLKRKVGCRSWSHVSVEIFERIKPALADFDVSRAIVFPSFTFRVVAALLHRIPSFKFWRTCHPVCFYQLATFQSLFHPEAATCYDATGSNVVQSGNVFVSAITLKSPVTATAFHESKLNSGKTAVTVAYG